MHVRKSYRGVSGKARGMLNNNRPLVLAILMVQLIFAYALLQSSLYLLQSSGLVRNMSKRHTITTNVTLLQGRVANDASKPDRPKVEVFILVKTIPSAYGRRKVMRETWLNELRKDRGGPEIIYRFFSEEPEASLKDAIEAEMEVEGDFVVLEDLLQKAHRKIGIKMTRSFKWIMGNYSPSHVVMVDDDTYVNLKRLKGDWPTWETSMHYMGYHMISQNVIKVPPGHVRVGKYGEHHRFPVNHWPRYASGPFYALSADLLDAFTNPPLPLRDMSSNDAMTGAVLLPYPVHYETREGLFMWGHKPGKPCIPAEKFYAMHITPKTYKGQTDLFLHPNVTWSAALHKLHNTVTSGQCIHGFT